MRICAVDDCDREERLRRGWCAKHYQRWLEHGDPSAPYLRRKVHGLCTVVGCQRPNYVSRGMCTMHWDRVRRGSPLDAPIRGQGELTTWSGVHQRLHATWGRAAQYLCIECGEQAKEWAYDGTDSTHRIGPSRPPQQNACYFSSWPEFYMPMCKKCHRRRDAAFAKAELHEYREWKVRNPGIVLADVDVALHVAAHS